MSYASLDQFQDWTDVPDADDNTEIQLALDAATRAIDRLCGRHFTLETDVTKTFWARDANQLDVVDLISASSITVDLNGDQTFARTLTANTDYVLLPYTDEAGYASTRFQAVRIWPTSSLGFVPGYLARIVGNWGYVDENDATPADVIQACLVLAARLWKRRETPFGVLSVPDMGTAVQIRKTDPDVAALLDPYVRGEMWVAV